MPDYRLMPDICSLTVRAKKLGIVCPYPMGGTQFNTGSLEQQQRARRALEQTHMSNLGKIHIRQQNLLDVPALSLRAAWGHR